MESLRDCPFEVRLLDPTCKLMRTLLIQSYKRQDKFVPFWTRLGKEEQTPVASVAPVLRLSSHQTPNRRALSYCCYHSKVFRNGTRDVERTLSAFSREICRLGSRDL